LKNTSYEFNERVRVTKNDEDETIKTYADKLLGITNKVRLLGTQFFDSRIVEKNPCNGT
jgi:hypothetical protein